MRKVLATLVLLFALTMPVSAQVTVPNTLVDGNTIAASELNVNFSTIANHALDRLSGGNLTGNVTADALVTIDGVDIGVQACVACTPTFGKVTTSNTSATSLTVGGGITAGTGVVGIVDATGKIPAISSTYFASLAGTNLTGIPLFGSANSWTNTNAFSSTTSFTNTTTFSNTTTHTGRLDLQQYTETLTVPTISGGALTLNMANSSQFSVTLNANATITLSNPAANLRAGSFTVAFLADGTVRTLTWPAAVKWAGGVAPTMTGTNGKVDIIQCITYTGGTTWYCFVGGQNF